MGTTVQQVAGGMSSTPTNGQPWNFQHVPESILIPRVVAGDSKLPPAARLLWGVIRQYSFRDGRCLASDQTLARVLALSRRQFIRHLRALENAKLVRSTPRPGKTTIRELAPAERFPVRKPQGVTDVARGGVINGTGGAPQTAPPYKEEGVLSGSSMVNRRGVLKNPPPKPAAPPAQKPAAEWSEQDYIARGRAMGFPEHVIARDIERARARRAKPQAERIVKASELASELQAAIRR